MVRCRPVQFTAIADDGVRLYIDGKRVIGQWQGPANTEFSYTAELGEASTRSRWTTSSGAATHWPSLSWDSARRPAIRRLPREYWNAPPGVNAIPGTKPELARDEDAIDHDWGEGSPGRASESTGSWPGGRTMSFAPGDYEFAVTADDGVRLYVDGVRVIDKWIDQGPTTYRTTLPLDGGPHKIVMEYYENGGGAVARLAYSRVGDPPADDTYRAEYWNTPDAIGARQHPDRPT